MTRTIGDMSGIVEPGDTINVVMVGPDGTPTGVSHTTTVDDLGRYRGRQAVARGEAKVATINRPPRR
ncbi:hypothetical protein ACFQ05_04415 [Amycolatopsis umgeniensis]|uniref:Uncharacterized protein n=1 Tax=Amycolatopsis umgeniensis TaxID=336628 RepID=A0A841B113_9PSEU|nr:hypothetical protein [Amycolatopsis umgeniensis]MBB5852510.1 hypothetical protein [Amycolatopsis umgeniensis]